MAAEAERFGDNLERALELATTEQVQLLARLACGLAQRADLQAKPEHYQWVYCDAVCRRYTFNETTITGVIDSPTKPFSSARLYTETPVGHVLDNGNQLLRVGEYHIDNRAFFLRKPNYRVSVQPTAYKLKTAAGLSNLDVFSSIPSGDRRVRAYDKVARQAFNTIAGVENSSRLSKGRFHELEYMLQAASTAKPIAKPDKQDTDHGE